MKKLLPILSYFFINLVYAQTPRFEEKWLAEKCSKPRNGQEISHVMLHFCSDAIENPQNPYNPDRIKQIFEQYQVSAHYLVGRDGTIYKFVKEDRMAFHAGKGKFAQAPTYENNLNIRSIGIEILAVSSKKDMKMFMSESHYEKIPKELVGFTDAQYKAIKFLLDDIYKRNPQIVKDRKHIVGHNEFAPERRTDPGELFDWTKIGF